jgi:hypothetical protein
MLVIVFDGEERELLDLIEQTEPARSHRAEDLRWAT